MKNPPRRNLIACQIPGPLKQTRDGGFDILIDKNLVLDVFYHRRSMIDLPQTMLKYPSTPFCNSWEWGGKLVAIVIGNRLVAYQAVTDFALSSADCLCYKYFPSIADIISNHRKVVEYSLFGFLRKVLSIKIYILFS